MPYRTYSREQDWLLPPSLGELLAGDHPVRFVAEFVEMLELAQVGIVAEPAVEGAASYHPRVLLGAWLYGFMVRIRTSRKLEAACTENVAFMWLTGLQRPDHVTLWRFYKANRQAVRNLLKQTVRLASEVGLVEFALLAVDGSRVAVASRDSLKGQAAVVKLLAQVEAEITAMEQANQGEDGPDGYTPPGPHALLGKREMRARLQRALAELTRQRYSPYLAAVSRNTTRFLHMRYSFPPPYAVVKTVLALNSRRFASANGLVWDDPGPENTEAHGPWSVGSESAPDDDAVGSAASYDRRFSFLLSGRGGTRTHDLTDVNQVFDPALLRTHGQAVLADREYSNTTIRAHYRSVASPCGLAIMCRCLEISPDKPSFQGVRP